MHLWLLQFTMRNVLFGTCWHKLELFYMAAIIIIVEVLPLNYPLSHINVRNTRAV